MPCGVISLPQLKNLPHHIINKYNNQKYFVIFIYLFEWYKIPSKKVRRLQISSHKNKMLWFIDLRLLGKWFQFLFEKCSLKIELNDNQLKRSLNDSKSYNV